MCDPITAIAVIGTGVSMFGQVKSANAAKRAGDAEAASYEELATARLDRVKYDIKAVSTNFVRERGKNVASIGQSGIVATSFYDVLADNTNELEAEKAAIRYSADREAKQLRSQGRVAFQAGKDAQTAGYINAVATGIKGASGINLSGPFAASGGWGATTTNAAGQVI